MAREVRETSPAEQAQHVASESQLGQKREIVDPSTAAAPEGAPRGTKFIKNHVPLEEMTLPDGSKFKLPFGRTNVIVTDPDKIAQLKAVAKKYNLIFEDL